MPGIFDDEGGESGEIRSNPVGQLPFLPWLRSANLEVAGTTAVCATQPAKKSGLPAPHSNSGTRSKTARVRRRPVGLTSLIDVIFLLLLFFMLASSFSRYQLLPVAGGRTGGGAASKPMLLRVHDKERWDLNGAAIEPGSLAKRLRDLSNGEPRSVAIWSGEKADVQLLVDAVATTRRAGLTPVVLTGD